MEKESYLIKQVSLFSENKPGRLATMAKAFLDEGINIKAFSIAEADGFGVIRVLVDKTREAYDKLTELGFNVAYTDVIAVIMRDEPGGLYEIAQTLANASINIEYSYAYSGKDKAVLILRVDHVEEAIEKIQSAGFQLVRQQEFL